jgi:hypothetical protein
MLYAAPLIPDAAGGSIGVVYRGASILSGSTVVSGIRCLGVCKGGVTAQLENGDVGFLLVEGLNNSGQQIVFKKQFHTDRLHDRILYSEESGLWYGFKSGQIDEYHHPYVLGDSLVLPYYYACRNVFKSGDLWSFVEVKVGDKPRLFWYSETEYFNEKLIDEFPFNEGVGLFHGYLGDAVMLLSVTEEVERLIVNLIPVDNFKCNTHYDADFLQGGQITPNSGMLITSERPNLTLNDTKVLLTAEQEFNVTITAFIY